MKRANRLLFSVVSCSWRIFGPSRLRCRRPGRLCQGRLSRGGPGFKSALETLGPSAALYNRRGGPEEGERAQAALNLRRAIVLDPRMTDARMAF